MWGNKGEWSLFQLLYLSGHGKVTCYTACCSWHLHQYWKKHKEFFWRVRWGEGGGVHAFGWLDHAVSQQINMCTWRTFSVCLNLTLTVLQNQTPKNRQFCDCSLVSSFCKSITLYLLSNLYQNNDWSSPPLSSSSSFAQIFTQSYQLKSALVTFWYNMASACKVHW